MKKLSKKYLFTLIGAAIGAMAGYLYWDLVGCSTGTCIITSKPLNSTVYGAVVGGLLFPLLQKNKKETA